jgi:hypothetical protein
MVSSEHASDNVGLNGWYHIQASSPGAPPVACDNGPWKGHGMIPTAVSWTTLLLGYCVQNPVFLDDLIRSSRPLHQINSNSSLRYQIWGIYPGPQTSDQLPGSNSGCAAQVKFGLKKGLSDFDSSYLFAHHINANIQTTDSGQTQCDHSAGAGC